MFETLEPRRLFTHDLYVHDVVLAGGIRPGEASILTAPISNFGPLNVTQPFFVEGKLIYTQNMFGVPNSDFYDPNAIPLFKTQVDADVIANTAGIDFGVTITMPEDLQTGRYTLVVAVDSTLEVVETNESNNYASALPERVYGGDKIARVDATDAKDYITITQSAVPSGGVRYTLIVDGESQVYSPSDIDGFYIRMLGGDDTFVAAGNIPGLTVDGSDGNDKILGGQNNDTLIGGAGKDTLFGNLGNDRLNGNGGNDRLYGETGSDRIYGYAGDDYMDGGSSKDRLEGGLGKDMMLGQSGNDVFFAQDNEIDQIFGATGTDTATADTSDILGSIERPTVV